MIKKNYIIKLHSGDKTVFKLLFEEYYPALVLFAKRFLRDAVLAEDIVQESFIILWDKRKELHSESGLKSYLYTTVRNKSINHLRSDKVKEKHAVEEKLKADFFDFESFFIEEESLRLFYAVIDELTDNQRAVILDTIEGFNRDEIAERMGITVDTVKYHKTKAYNYIRERFAKNYYFLFLLAQILRL